MVAVHWKEEKEGQREMHRQDQSSVLQLGLEFGFNPKKSVCPTWVPGTAPDASGVLSRGAHSNLMQEFPSLSIQREW